MPKKLLSNGDIPVEEFLIRLMNIESSSSNEGSLADELIGYFKGAGWYTIEQQINDHGNRRNLLITHKPFQAPMPPFIPPTSDGSVVKGRGANDAKAQLAAMIFAARRIAKEEPNLADDLGLLFLVGEEVDHIGMIAANNLKLKPEYLVIGEPTQLKFGRMQKGSLKKAILNVEGKAAHSGYPELGESAVEKLLEILQDIRNYKWSESKELRKTTLNIDIDIISGGQALNALAAKASAKPFFRVTTSTADISKRLKDIVSNRVQIDFSLGKNEPVHLNESPIDVDSCVISFNTDLSYFNNKDLLKGGYLFAAGDIRNAHSDNEFIRIAVLHLAVETHINLFRRLISESPANDDIARD